MTTKPTTILQGWLVVGLALALIGVAVALVLMRPTDFAMLERTGCFGRCPTVRLVIRSDDSVGFEGEPFVAVVGGKTAKVDESGLAELAATFRAAQIVVGPRVVRCWDAPHLGFTFDGRTVEDWCGRFEVTALADRIDGLAGVRNWARGTR